MKKKWIVGLTLAALHLQAANPVFPPGQTASDMAKMIVFLTSQGSVFGEPGMVGLSYVGSFGDLSGEILPSSFYSSPNYWLYYVGDANPDLLTVTDVFNNTTFVYVPLPIPPYPPLSFPTFLKAQDLQAERTNAFVGANIYDASVWQIALALAGQGGFTGPSGTSLFDILENQTTLLTNGQYSSQTTIVGSLRGTTQPGGIFLYGGKPIETQQNAYFFRMVPPSFLNADPLYFNTTPDSFIKSSPNPPCVGCTPMPVPPAPSNYFQGNSSWTDFKPITGENAWAFFLGPLHAALIKQATLGQTYVPFSSNAVQNAINVMLAFQYMQSAVGGVYYIVSGSLGNNGPVDVYTVSVENNFSVLGGLYTLQRILNDELANETDLTVDNKATINATLSAIDAMLNGGTVAGGTQTKGLLSFFRNQAWNSTHGMFEQGGLANKPGQPEWVPPSPTDPQAVDVQTWGIACLGQPTIDSWFGFGTAYNMWQKTKAFGGYYGPDGRIWGVGFSNLDGNGPCSATSRTGVYSGEWSAGAINMARVLITQYKKVALNADRRYTAQQAADAALWVINLEEEEESMLQNILKLRTDIYPTVTDFYLIPPNYNQLLYGSGGPPSDRLAFLYADRRYQIPFGWIANPIPSLASTGWMAFLYFNFNPFNPLGTYDVHPTPLTGAIQASLSRYQQVYEVPRVQMIRQTQFDKVGAL